MVSIGCKLFLTKTSGMRFRCHRKPRTGVTGRGWLLNEKAGCGLHNRLLSRAGRYPACPTIILPRAASGNGTSAGPAADGRSVRYRQVTLAQHGVSMALHRNLGRTGGRNVT